MENNKFYVGQEVLCIKTHSGGEVIKGEKYIINGIKRGCEHTNLLLDIGKASETTRNKCRYCNYSHIDIILWFSCYLFSPIDNELSELTAEDILEEELVKVNR